MNAALAVICMLTVYVVLAINWTPLTAALLGLAIYFGIKDIFLDRGDK